MGQKKMIGSSFPFTAAEAASEASENVSNKIVKSFVRWDRRM